MPCGLAPGYQRSSNWDAKWRHDPQHHNPHFTLSNSEIGHLRKVFVKRGLHSEREMSHCKCPKTKKQGVRGKGHRSGNIIHLQGWKKYVSPKRRLPIFHTASQTRPDAAISLSECSTLYKHGGSNANSRKRGLKQCSHENLAECDNKRIFNPVRYATTNSNLIKKPNLLAESGVRWMPKAQD